MSLTYKLTDTIPKPSISVVELNNVLVKMRKLVKAAKVLIYRDIKRYIRLLSKKAERCPDNVRLQKKVEHRSEELSQLRGLTVSRLCKLLMVSDYTENSLSQQGGRLDGQERLIVRLSLAKPVAAYLASFRREHPDWRSLAQYLLYKNVSGKWKSRQQKKRNRLVHGSLPLPKAPSNGLADSPAVEKETPFYRVRQPPGTEGAQETGEDLAHPTGYSESLPPHPPLVDDVDSDAASDIADQLVTRLLANAGSEHWTLLPRSRTAATKNLARKAQVHSTDAVMPGAGRHRRIDGKVLQKKFERLSGQTTPGKPLDEAPKGHRFGKKDDDDQLFGSDDVEMRRSKSRKARPPPASDNRTTRGRPAVAYRRRETRPSEGYQRTPWQQPDQRRGSTLQPAASPAKEAMQNLHPSWQAKREQKLRLASLIKLTDGSSASQSKRIVFED